MKTLKEELNYIINHNHGYEGRHTEYVVRDILSAIADRLPKEIFPKEANAEYSPYHDGYNKCLLDVSEIIEE